MPDAPFRLLSFDDLPGWDGADPAPAFAAFLRSAPSILSGAHRAGTFGLDPERLRPAAEAALDAPATDPRAFFRNHFAPALIMPARAGGRGFLTGYYEPVLRASRERTEGFRFPLLRRPPDLVAITGADRPASLPASFAFARKRPDGTLEEHPDRAAIAGGALDGRGLEIAFLESEVDAFFIHVQGSARLELEDGRQIRVGYAAKTGHDYTPIGRVLVERGALTREEADMDGIRRWLAANPGEIRPLLDRNRSYIFFEERKVRDETEGPVGGAGVPLTALGSLALDHRIHTYGMPVFLDAAELRIEGNPFRRLLVAQDTGSAIVGPARGDIFVGSGEAAGHIAGAVRHRADFYALLPKARLR